MGIHLLLYFTAPTQPDIIDVHACMRGEGGREREREREMLTYIYI